MGVPVARVGMQTYKAEEVDKDGKLNLSGLVDVYRSPDEVFKPASIQSFEGKSVVSPHPPQFLNSDNDSLYSKGHGQNFRAGTHPETGAPVLLGDLVIKDATLAHLIEEGHRVEISGGYTYDLEREDDEFSPRSRFVQKNICGNHIAIVPTGRAGSDIKVLDAKPEEGEPMAEEAKVVSAQPGMLADLATFLKTAGLRLVGIDEDPGVVERNEKKDKEALTKKLRVDDSKSEEMEKEEKGAKEPDKKEEKGEDKKKGKDSVSATDARLDRVCDLLEKVLARDNKTEDKCTCDAEEGEGHKKDCAMYKKESEDADLIPIHKLHGDEIPQNPIPGADAALAQLRKIRPLIAQSEDKQAIDAYNDAVRQLKAGRGKGEDGGDYSDFTKLKKPEKVENDESRIRASDSKFHRTGEEAGADFEAAAAKYHRINASEVKKQ